MKTAILTIFVASTLLISCGNNDQKATTQEAKQVNTVTTSETATYKTVTKDSNIDWRASHLGGVKQRYGKVLVKDATFLVNANKLTNATVTMDLNSLTVTSFPAGSDEITDLEKHLKSDDFFNTSKYPTSKFELTKLEETSGDYNSKITGNLTISDITKNITFNANVAITADKVSIKSEDFSINRADWNLTYNAKGTQGVPVDYLISDAVGFTINVAATK